MVYAALCAHTHKFLLSSRTLFRHQHPTRFQQHFQTLHSHAHSHSFTVNNTFKPSHLLCSRNSRLSALSNDGNGGRGAGGSVPNSGGGDSWSSGGDGGDKWSFLSWYMALLGKYPVSVKALTSALLTLVGDLICQHWGGGAFANHHQKSVMGDLPWKAALACLYGGIFGLLLSAIDNPA